ncbi:MAG: copper amine oxidase N-terminal domain-containing protein [Clostridia bacterium]|nr:copper amine oxidase N-terminal domain-containing protein [Clostridia bacterium]
MKKITRKLLVKMISFMFVLACALGLSTTAYAGEPIDYYFDVVGTPIVGNKINDIKIVFEEGGEILNIDWYQVDEFGAYIADVNKNDVFEEGNYYATDITFRANGRRLKDNGNLVLYDQARYVEMNYVNKCPFPGENGWTYDEESDTYNVVFSFTPEARDVLNLYFYYPNQSGTYEQISRKDLFVPGKDLYLMRVGTSLDDLDNCYYLKQDGQIDSSWIMESDTLFEFCIQYKGAEHSFVFLDGCQLTYDNGWYNTFSQPNSYYYYDDETIDDYDGTYITFTDVIEPDFYMDIINIEYGRSIDYDYGFDNGLYFDIDVDTDWADGGYTVFALRGDYTNNTEYLDYIMPYYEKSFLGGDPHIQGRTFDDGHWAYYEVADYSTPYDTNYNGVYTLIITSNAYDNPFLASHYSLATIEVNDTEEYKYKYPIVFLEDMYASMLHSSSMFAMPANNSTEILMILTPEEETDEYTYINKVANGAKYNDWYFDDYMKELLAAKFAGGIGGIPVNQIYKFLYQYGFLEDDDYEDIEVYYDQAVNSGSFNYDGHKVFVISKDDDEVIAAYEDDMIYLLTNTNYIEKYGLDKEKLPVGEPFIQGYSKNIKNGLTNNVYVTIGEEDVLYDSLRVKELENFNSFKNMDLISILYGGNYTLTGINREGNRIELDKSYYSVAFRNIIQNMGMEAVIYNELDHPENNITIDKVTRGLVNAVFLVTLDDEKHNGANDQFTFYMDMNSLNGQVAVAGVPIGTDYGTNPMEHIAMTMEAGLNSIPELYSFLIEADPDACKSSLVCIDEMPKAISGELNEATFDDTDLTYTVFYYYPGKIKDVTYFNSPGQLNTKITLTKNSSMDIFPGADEDEYDFMELEPEEMEEIINYYKKFGTNCYNAVYDEEHNGTTVVVRYTMTTKPAPTSGGSSKKYKATDTKDTTEKITGSGKKGSTRTIVPEEGRKVASVKVVDKNGNEIPVTMNEDGTYSFEQPASNVDVLVSYKNREITLNIGSTEASVDGERENLDVCPVIRNDRTMLPIRFVAENLGAKVEWSEKNPNYVVITRGDTKIEITLGSDIMKVNGKDVKLDSVAFAENDRTYLPVRAISEALNAIVEWNENEPSVVKIYERQ